jgi:hypothetical protein
MPNPCPTSRTRLTEPCGFVIARWRIAAKSGVPATVVHSSPRPREPLGGHDFEQGRNFLRNEAIPRIKQAPGFVSDHWVRLDESSGTSMLVFESEEAARAAAEQIRATPPGGEFVTLDTIQVGEVVESA